MEHDIKVAIFTLINEINKKGKALLQQLEVRECSFCSCGYNWVVVYVHSAHYKYVNCSFFEQYDFENDFESSPHDGTNVLIRLIQLLQIPSGLLVKWTSSMYGLHMLVRTPYSILVRF